MRHLSLSAGFMLALLCACSSPERSGCCDVVKHDDTYNARRDGDDSVLISLTNSLTPLRHRFNLDKGRLRLVALLSPT